MLKAFCLAFILARSSLAFSEIPAARAESLIHDIMELFESDIQQLQQLRVKVEFHWESEAFQAQGGRMGDHVLFRFYGGLLRGAMDEEVLSVVVCHELGHVLGGYPEVRPYPYNKNSVEGQADYFVTTKCLRRIFADQNNSQIIASRQVPVLISEICDGAFATAELDAVCVRSLLASQNAFQIMYEEPGLGFAAADPTVVSKTLMGYPSTQCRMDTLKAGAVCTKLESEMFSYKNASDGACMEGGAQQSRGARPRCWFKN